MGADLAEWICFVQMQLSMDQKVEAVGGDAMVAEEALEVFHRLRCENTGENTSHRR